MDSIGLAREMREEIGVEITVDRLVWVVENFYVNDDNGKSYHEIGFYFLMSLPEESPLLRQNEFVTQDEGYVFTFKWHPTNVLPDINLVPTFLRTTLQNIPETTVHIVHTDKPL